MKNSMKILLGFCLAFCLAQTALAATYTVTKIADTNDGICDADCSLREAVAAAAATTDNDTIQFSALFNQAQTITLSGTDIIITGNGTLSINGPGANLLTVSGNNASRVFTNQIIGTTQAVTNISNLRVTNGNGVSTVVTGRGGGIYNNGSVLTLDQRRRHRQYSGKRRRFEQCDRRSQYDFSQLHGSNNTSTSSGGGMQNFSTSTMTILNSTISGNTSNGTGVAGGAVQANGTVFIANSTFSGNNAPAGTGGGIYFNGTVLTMNNVTITNNTTGTGAGGLHKTTTNPANIRNTIIAGNTGGEGTPDVVGAVTSRGNNLIGVIGTSTGWIASDILNRPAFLAPLANNGGATQTHALLPNSPAINAGQNCVVTATCVEANPPTPLTTDQRGAGFPRQVAGTVDIGAFESTFTAVTSSAPFDFDGDGRTDFAVFRPSTGTWFLNRSTAGAFAVQFGSGSDRLAPADYDGDGKTDIAVWREASFAHFYILNSSNNTVRGEQFGTTGDIPVPGDWDGDGRADPAVYRVFVGIPGSNPPSVFYFRPSGSAGR
jgi:CSLREA domain-containing protein